MDYKIEKVNYQISGKDHYLFTDKNDWKCYIDDYVRNLLENPQKNPSDYKIIENILIHNKPVVELKSEQFKTSNNIKVSLVIVNWNGAKFLRECFDSLLEQTYKNFEVIISDNDPIGSSVEIIKEYQSKGLDIKLVENGKNIGFNLGNNIGARHATGDIYFFVNNDVKLDPNCITNAINVFETEKNVGAVFPKLVFYDRPGLINGLEAKWHFSHLWLDYSIGKIDLGNQTRKKILGSIFAAVFITREALEYAGRFDNDLFTYAEDLDLCYRINACGYDIYSEPNSFLYHKYRSSSQDNSNPGFGIYYSIRNYAMILFADIDISNWFKVLPRFFKRFYFLPIRNHWQNKNKQMLLLYAKIIIGLLWNLPGAFIKNLRNTIRRKRKDTSIWDYESRENYDIFFYDRKPVISELNIKTASEGSVSYEINGQIFKTF